MSPRAPAGDPKPARNKAQAAAATAEHSTAAADATQRARRPESTSPSPQSDEAEQDISAELSFREAQTALELSLAELQSPELDVEEMAALYRRASRYAERCEQLLKQVEQEVTQWDPQQPQDPPGPYEG